MNKEVGAECPEVNLFGLFDDYSLFGSEDEALHAVSKLSMKLMDIGLDLNWTKCHVLAPKEPAKENWNPEKMDKGIHTFRGCS